MTGITLENTQASCLVTTITQDDGILRFVGSYIAHKVATYLESSALFICDLDFEGMFLSCLIECRFGECRFGECRFG